ncbi:MAG TPA: IS630 family transposase [Ktedonobacteraceae bacterium]
MKQIQTEHPQASVEVWAMDEHRIGLKPLLRRVWVRNGSRPSLHVQQRYEWMYLYGFVHPQSGRTEWLILPTVDIETMNLALVQFAHAVGASPEKQIALVLDQAGWHASSHVQIPEGLHLLFLPPYSPELQPSERLWPLSNEGIASRYFSSLAALEEAQIQRCQILLERREIIHGTTCFHWWPADPQITCD